MSNRDYLTIGEVVQRLESSYPDLSISKVRFLEEEGLVSPERTAGGYRKFSQADVARVEMILRMQRDHFLPLAVIRQKLANYDRGRIPAELQKTSSARVEPVVSLPHETGPLPFDEAPVALGVPASFLRELVEFGLIRTRKDDNRREVLDRSDVPVIHATWDLRKFGVEPRHLKMYENFADREATLFSQILMPTFRHKTPEAKQKLDETLSNLSSLTEQLKNHLLRRALGKVFEDFKAE
jgi:DNA-binding transcriptional MerR regulator